MILFQYLFKLSICLAVIYLFYHFVLRRLTFYNRNRWYLLGYSFLSFFFPLMNITWMLEKNEWSNSQVLKFIPAVDGLTGQATQVAETSSAWTALDWFLLLFAAGALIMIVRLCIQLFSFRKLYKKIELLSEDEVKLYQVNEEIIPFSFGKAIFVNKNLHSEEELKEIIRHEFVHVRQRHIIDVIWGEILCIINWYNPFAWLIRKAIRQNLEFIADNQVLQEGIDKKQYQYLLLKVIGNTHYSIANQFNFSSLKKRIAMMNKIKSAKIHLAKFIFLIPLMAVLLLAFRNNIVGHAKDNIVTVTSADDTSKKQMTKVDTILWMKDNKVVEVNLSKLERLDGHKLLMLNGVEVASYQHLNPEQISTIKMLTPKEGEKKYGNKGKDGAIEVQTKEIIATPVTDTVPDQKVPNDKGYYLDIKDNNGQCVVVVRDKDRKIIEKVDLVKWNRNLDTYEGKYGEIPPVPAMAPREYVINGVRVIGDPSKLTATEAIPPITTKVDGGKLVHVDARGVNVATTALSEVVVSGRPVATTVALEPVTAIGRQIVKGESAIASVQEPLIATTAEGLEDVTVTGYPIQPTKLDIVYEFYIYKRSTKADFEKIIAEARAKGIEVSFDGEKYDSNNQLVSISGKVSKENAKSNFTLTDFEVIRVFCAKKSDGKYTIRIHSSDKKEVS